ncbi:MAG TPA: C4-type zinc ribbon domain-containing protein [Planctomycetota bacterium]
MKADLERLVQVQRADERLAVLQRRLDSIPAERGERESRQSVLEAAAEAIETERKEALSRSRELENEASTWQTRLAKIEDQINNTRDAGSIQIAEREAQELRDRISAAEEEALRLLEHAEVVIEKRDQARAAALDSAAELALFKRTLEQDEADLRADFESEKARRTELVSGVARATRETYEKLLPARKGRALSPLRGESCGGCGMVVPPNDRLRVNGATAVTRCRSCSRILVPAEIWNADTAPTADATSDSGDIGDPA